MADEQRILLCSDLDRTLIPNGAAEESLAARPLLRRLAARPEVLLCYVSGRHQSLIRSAITTYQLPVPDFAIGDVGASLYRIQGEQWLPCDSWQQAIASDWGDMQRGDIAASLGDLPQLRAQEADKQGEYKQSYYVSVDVDLRPLLQAVEERLCHLGIAYSLISSHDEVNDVHLLDVLPQRATKLGAIRFLMTVLGCARERVIFAGDSGNDLPVLSSELQAILVANAADDIRAEALAAVAHDTAAGHLYLAQGGLLGMNGNYSAGVLEGVVNAFPETLAWLTDDSEET